MRRCSLPPGVCCTVSGRVSLLAGRCSLRGACMWQSDRTAPARRLLFRSYDGSGEAKVAEVVIPCEASVCPCARAARVWSPGTTTTERHPLRPCTPAPPPVCPPASAAIGRRQGTPADARRPCYASLNYTTFSCLPLCECLLV